MMIYNKNRNKGFTVVELIVVIVTIGILAGIVGVVYGSSPSTTAKSVLKSDLVNAATAMENSRNFGSSYPTTFPAGLQASANIVLEMTSAPAGSFCINGYSTQYTSVRMSISSGSSQSPSQSLCNYPNNGAVLGGTVPSTPTGTNIAPSFDNWTLAGSAAYNSSTGELTFGANGTATSPKLRVNGVNGLKVNGQFYATAQSANASLQPFGGWHSGTVYYQSDGTTSATNTGGYAGNGCALKVTLNSWNSSLGGDCTYALGNNVAYVVISLYGPPSGYTSSDLKIKNLTVILN